MPSGTLHIDLDAIAANWRNLDRLSGQGCETSAVVKADAYGLGVVPVVNRLAQEGARAFFVATADEGLEVRRTLGPEPRVYVLYGHMPGDTSTIQRADLVPMVTSLEQAVLHIESLPRHPFGIQLDTGMNRLGLKAADWADIAPVLLEAEPVLIMSHLACADDPDHPMNDHQLRNFRHMIEGIDAPLSLAATGGTLLGAGYHFDMTRPGIGLYGGLPYGDATPVVSLELPVIACFDVAEGEASGYGATWTAPAPTRLATVAAGYADGLPRALAPGLEMMAGPVPCPVVGRVSMDLMTIDIGHLETDPTSLSILDLDHGVDDLADKAGTIGYEMFTSLGRRYGRSYRNGSL
ncbi:MAG: alanine racemase [Pseudomonadota bacterium]